MAESKHKKLVLIALALVFLSPLAASLPKVFASSSTITAQGSKLYLNSQQYLFTGVNAYELATDHSINWGCGGMLAGSDMDAFFAGLRPNSLVRFWAFQDLAINKNTNLRDWTGVDRVFAAAQTHNQRLLVTIGNHWNACDGGGQKNDAWYQGGYMQPFSPDGYQYRVSYWDYLQELVNRYKTSPALGMWELVNEPEMTCGGHVQDLKTFFDTVGGKLKSIDSSHLLEMGVAGGNQCSVVGTDYATLLSSPAIDVADYHDYNAETQAMPGSGDPSGLPARIQQAQAANKPIIIGESGIHGSDTASGCTSLATRLSEFKAKMDAQFSAGISGYLPWNWQLSSGGCAYDITPGDPLMTLLATYNLSLYLPTATAATPSSPTPSKPITTSNATAVTPAVQTPVSAAPPLAPATSSSPKASGTAMPKPTKTIDKNLLPVAVYTTSAVIALFTGTVVFFHLKLGFHNPLSHIVGINRVRK